MHLDQLSSPRCRDKTS